MKRERKSRINTESRDKAFFKHEPTGRELRRQEARDKRKTPKEPKDSNEPKEAE